LRAAAAKVALAANKYCAACQTLFVEVLTNNADPSLEIPYYGSLHEMKT
jgi:hypothetical protein